MVNVKPKSNAKVLSVGVTTMQNEAIEAAGRRNRWTGASFNRYAIVKELMRLGCYDPTTDPENFEDFDADPAPCRTPSQA